MGTVRIRDAEATDAADIARIYNHYVLETTATFDTHAKTADERTGWLENHDAAHPVLVAETDGRVRAWGCLTQWAERPAWRHTVEVSVYVDLDARGRGLGSDLMVALMERAADAGHHTVIGQIVSGNDASLALARRLGFEQAGRLTEVGRKFDRWLDVVLMEKHLEDPKGTEEGAMCSEDRGEAENDSVDQADVGAPGANAPSPDAFRRNLAGEMPLARKSWLVARNSALKIVRLKDCCGHPGEPGC